MLRQLSKFINVINLVYFKSVWKSWLHTGTDNFVDGPKYMNIEYITAFSTKSALCCCYAMPCLTTSSLFTGHEIFLNSPPRGKNCRHFADDTFKCVLMNKNICIIRILLKYVPKGPIDNRPALVQVRAWRWSGDKPLPEPILTQFTDAYMRH